MKKDKYVKFIPILLALLLVHLLISSLYFDKQKSVINNHISGSLKILDATAKHNANTIVSKVSNLREIDTDASLPNERFEVCIFC